MKHLKTWKSTNELFGIGSKIRSFSNKDESVGNHILNLLDSKKNLHVEESKTKKLTAYDSCLYTVSYEVNIDGFDIKSSQTTNGDVKNPNEYILEEYGPHNVHTISYEYSLFINGEEAECSIYIKKKIWMKIQSIYQKETSQIADYKKAYNLK